MADIEQAFAQTWALTGTLIPAEELPSREDIPISGRLFAALWPRLIVVPLAALSAWVAPALLIRAWRLWR